MKFAVTGTDARFEVLRTLLIRDGHELVAPAEAEVIVPPPWDKGAFYARSETYAVANAALTARGAAERLRAEGVAGGDVLILGYGRVGRLCARALAGPGRRVTAAARRGEQRAWAEAEGCAAVDLEGLSKVLPVCAAVVNTVPAPVLGEADISRLPRDAVLLELASAPGGIDAAAAREQGLRYIRAGGLPAQYDPEAAAEILRDAVYEMLAQKKPRLGAALTGSHCTFDRALEALRALRGEYELVPILSEAAARTDTRFGAAADFRRRLEELCGRGAVDSVAGAEPLGAQAPLDALLIAPCTGNTLAKLANGVTDTPVTMAAKAHLRNGRPLVLAVSTNDGLSGSAANIAALLQRKNVYFVPFGQDDPEKKPWSLQADFSLLARSVESAMRGEQLQPVLL